MSVCTYIKDNHEIIVAISSILIALVALIFSIWQGRKTIKHNKLSLRPSLEFNILAIVMSNEVSISLKNSGIGPAVIKSINLFFDGVQFDHNIYNWEHLLKTFNFPSKSYKNIVSTISTDYYIAPNADHELLTIELLDGNEISETDLRDFVSHIRFEVNYTSVYGEKFFNDTTL